ncbi:MAG TPA: EAL domain-containing protein [Micromonosporaceae bacterium]|nr:EAL domain-containing protein [Micromonosporaceae bacterium]
MAASAPQTGGEQFSHSGAERYAQTWTWAVAQVGFLPLSSAEAEQMLLGHTLNLARAFLSRPFTARPAYDVGRALVNAHLTDPKVIEWSVRALGEEFLPAVFPGRRWTRPVRHRIADLQGALAAGFAQALRDRTFLQQERISRSAWSARDLAEQALRESEARFRAVFAGAAIGIGIADVNGQIVDVNQCFADMLGYTIAELRQFKVADLFHKDDAAGMWELYNELIKGKHDTARVEKRYYRKDGSYIWTNLSVSLIRHDDGRPRFTVAMIEDITDRHDLQERLRFQALHDPLTGLPNRIRFFEQLDVAFGSASPDDRIAVCVLDLDGFKGVNGGLGHDVGDRVLAVVAQRLTECVADRGYLVSRMGGDKFVILIEGSSGPEEVIDVARASLGAVAQPIRLGKHQVTVSASIGVVEAPVAETVPADLIKAADTTLYWAKAEGRGRYAVYDPVRDRCEKAKSALADALPTALERGEFTIDYQPIVTLADGTVQAVEALVRWRHPQLGLLGPDRFISLAEETGLIVRLGRWVLQQACEDASHWRRKFPERRIVVSVNLAVRQAQEPGIAAEVADVLKQTGLPAELLQLELTESAVMVTTGEPLQALHQLAELGVRLAIDDFGTGYSNLAYLRRLPIHSLKLAGPFVEGLRSEEPTSRDEQIVDALVRLAHALGLSVTAEAVERAEQAERLRALGCDTGQGRYFFGPVGAAGIDALLSERGAGPTGDRVGA